MKERFGTRTTVAPADLRADVQEPTLVDKECGRAHELSQARANFEKARLALEMGKARLAVTLLQSCLSIEADHPEYLGLWGYSQTLIGGNLKAAQDACERAVAARSYDATLYAQLGCVLQASGRTESARHCYENALIKDPQQKLAKAQLQSLIKQSDGFSLKTMLRRLRR